MNTNDITIFAIVLIAIAVSGLVFMGACNKLDRIFTMHTHPEYKNIGREILKSQIASIVFGACLGSTLMYAILC